jgi:hypothetical protein
MKSVSTHSHRVSVNSSVRAVESLSGHALVTFKVISTPCQQVPAVFYLNSMDSVTQATPTTPLEIPVNMALLGNENVAGSNTSASNSEDWRAPASLHETGSWIRLQNCDPMQLPTLTPAPSGSASVALHLSQPNGLWRAQQGASAYSTDFLSGQMGFVGSTNPRRPLTLGSSTHASFGLELNQTSSAVGHQGANTFAGEQFCPPVQGHSLHHPTTLPTMAPLLLNHPLQHVIYGRVSVPATSTQNTTTDEATFGKPQLSQQLTTKPSAAPGHIPPQIDAMRNVQTLIWKEDMHYQQQQSSGAVVGQFVTSSNPTHHFANAIEQASGHSLPCLHNASNTAGLHTSSPQTFSAGFSGTPWKALRLSLPSRDSPQYSVRSRTGVTERVLRHPWGPGIAEATAPRAIHGPTVGLSGQPPGNSRHTESIIPVNRTIASGGDLVSKDTSPISKRGHFEFRTVDPLRLGQSKAASGQEKRSRFPNQERQNETAETRKNMACVRCQVQKIRVRKPLASPIFSQKTREIVSDIPILVLIKCEPDPDNRTGTCLTCKKAFAEKASNDIHCHRIRLTTCTLYRTGKGTGLEFTKRWPTPMLTNLPPEDWTSPEVRRLKVLSDVCPVSLELRVRKFRPVFGDVVYKQWVDEIGNQHYHETTPYAIVDMEAAAKDMEHHVRVHALDSVHFLTGQSDQWIKETYAYAEEYMGKLLVRLSP